MFLDEMVKDIVRKFLLPVTTGLYRLGLTAHHSTIISMIFKVLTLWFLYAGDFFLGAVCMVLEYLFDFLDGAIARGTRTESKLGFYLDNVGDTFFRVLWFPAFALAGVISWNLAIWLMVSFLVLFAITLSVRVLKVGLTLPLFKSVMWLIPLGLAGGFLAWACLALFMFHSGFILYNLSLIIWFRE